MNKKSFSLLNIVALVCVVSIGLSCQTSGPKKGMMVVDKIKIRGQLAESEIRSRILTYTPIGSSANEVLMFAQDRLKHGDGKPEYRQYPVIKHFDNPQKEAEAVGKRSIEVFLCRYGWNPFLRTEVYVSWAFDENDKLTDVIVEKVIDAL